MPNKQDLAALLGGKAGAPEIRRGRGVTLSTEAAAPEEVTSAAPIAVQPDAAAPAASARAEAPPQQEPELPSEITVPPTPTPVRSAALPATRPQTATDPHALPERRKREPAPSGASRLNRGFAVRPDLARAFKLIAAYDDRKIFDVMEQAMQEYADRWRNDHPHINLGL